MENYVAGPIFLVKPDERLPPGALTVSHCLAQVAPGTWAIDWVTATDAERLEAGQRCGIPEAQLPSVIAWTTERFDTHFAWSHVFLDLGAAREFREHFLSKSFQILQIGLHDRYLADFLALAAPPPQEPGYASNGSTGVYKALMASSPLVGGDFRGFEVLGYDRYGGGFDSFRCNAFESDFARLGATFNEWGLIEHEADALQCAAFAGSPEVGTCADAWHPWVIVEHPLQAGPAIDR